MPGFAKLFIHRRATIPAPLTERWILLHLTAYSIGPKNQHKPRVKSACLSDQASKDSLLRSVTPPTACLQALQSSQRRKWLLGSQEVRVEGVWGHHTKTRNISQSIRHLSGAVTGVWGCRCTRPRTISFHCFMFWLTSGWAPSQGDLNASRRFFSFSLSLSLSPSVFSSLCLLQWDAYRIVGLYLPSSLSAINGF